MSFWCEALGYARFWIAEHHALGALASSAPEVLIGHAASATSQIRVGSGGMADVYKGIQVACGPPGLEGGKNILYRNTI